MKEYLVEGHRVVDFEITVYAENKEKARSKVVNREFSDEELDSYEETWAEDTDLEVDHVHEVNQVKQTTLKR